MPNYIPKPTGYKITSYNEQTTMSLFMRYKTDSNGQKYWDARTLEDLLNSISGLVFKWVTGFFLSNSYMSHDDLFLVGMAELTRILPHFQLEQNVKLQTYVKPYVCGKIRNYIRDNHGGVYTVSRDMQQKDARLANAEKEFYANTGREATLRELSERTGLSLEDIQIIMEIRSGKIPIPIINGNNDAENEPGIEPAAPTPSEDVSETKDLIWEALNRLKDANTRKIIELHYLKDPPLSQAQIAKILGCSQATVSARERNALKELKTIIISIRKNS